MHREFSALQNRKIVACNLSGYAMSFSSLKIKALARAVCSTLYRKLGISKSYWFEQIKKCFFLFWSSSLWFYPVHCLSIALPLCFWKQEKSEQKASTVATATIQSHKQLHRMSDQAMSFARLSRILYLIYCKSLFFIFLTSKKSCIK